ncbi:heme/copper-type cytochrome/quinol oxidase subunit 2 [Lysinibacillus sp. TE18511]
MKIFIFILITITTLFSWFKFRKEIKIAESNEEIRQAFVRFMLMLFLFLIFIVSVGFY